VIPARVVSCLFTVLLIASCSRAPDLGGTWKNGDGNLLIFKSDTLVLLGQDGLQGGDSGSYTLRDGAMHIVTRTQADQLGSFHNEYFLTLRGDSLLLDKLTLYRGGDFHEIIIDSLARRMGKVRERFAFTRRTKP
jgi:hypothetical protein